MYQKKVEIDESKLLYFKNFSSNFIDQIQNTPYKNEDFLLDMEEKLWQYAFKNGEPPTFENSPKEIAFLRNHYLHWNSTYGEEGMEVALQTSYPNKVDNKRKRLVR